VDIFFLQSVVNGISVGLSYGLVAIGFTLIFGVLRAINFAHSEVYTLGAFGGLALLINFAPPLLAVVLFAAAIGAVAGFSLERIAFRPFRRAKDETSLRSPALREATLMSSLAVGIIVREAIEIKFGGAMQPIPQDALLNTPVMLNPFIVSDGDLVIAGTAILMLGGLVFLFKRTNIGLSIRAVADDLTGALCTGVNANAVIVWTFVIGSTFGAVSGLLIGLYYGAIFPFMGFTPVLKAFVAMIMGGVNSVAGAVVCALLLGIIENVSIDFVSTRWVDGIAYGLLLVTLVFFPRGLFSGSAERV
jgi:branched-chain amino acid transport system permease protein